MPHFFRPPPDALPPAEVRCTNLRAEPLGDGRRIRVYLDLTPFLQPPDVFVTLSDAAGKEITHSHLIGVVNQRLTIILHLRTPVERRYILTATVNYPALNVSNEHSVVFEPPVSTDTENHLP
ncbi:MAG: hypothetical protein WHV66_08895 [Anaerolineales bacterium]|jgi:hypothetical protein